ncbi:PIN domain-containing protein [Candidatus Pacearchaeota archaeon]|nr:PIN domain-containing protein [Candidatus Pacearchaeota archaeon]
MNLIIDANILFSALIKDNLSHTLLFNEKFRLFTPEYIFTELEEHKEEILDKTERTTEEFFKMIETLKRRIVIVPLEELVPYIEEAENITLDTDDMAYFALALKLKCPIWSNDKHLKNQDKVIIYSTEDLLNVLGDY